RHRGVGLRLELAALHMQVELLLTETKRDPPLAEPLERHAEHLRVEADAGIGMARRENEVVESVDHRIVRHVARSRASAGARTGAGAARPPRTASAAAT